MRRKPALHWHWVCLAPTLLLLGLGLLAPGIQTLALALSHPSDLGRLLADGRFYSSLGFTLGFSALAVPFEVALGLLLGLALAKPLPFSWLWRSCLLLPWALPSVVSSKLFAWIFHYQLGLANLILVHLFGDDRINWLAESGTAWFALLSLELWKTVPLVALLLMAGRQQLSNSIYEAAAIDGASSLSTLKHITLPLLRPFILVAGLFRLVDGLRIFDSVWALTGGGPAQSTESLSFYAHALYFRDFDQPYGAWVSLAGAGLTLGAALLITRAGSFEADLQGAA